MKKQPEVTAQTRQNLIDAFWTLYCTKPIGKISVKEITAIATYNRGTFYEYFIDVYDVLEQIEKSLLLDNSRVPFVVKLPKQPINDDKSILFDSLYKYYEENRKYLTVLLSEYGDPAFLSKMKQTIKPVVKQEMLAKGAMDNYKLDVVIEYNISAMIGVFNYWFSLDTRPALEEFVNLIIKIKNTSEADVIKSLMSE